MIIPFNEAPYFPDETKYINEVLCSGHSCGDGSYSKKCTEKIEKITGCEHVLLTTSCSAALDMAAILLDIQPGDEVIMPSFTFVSTANSFVLRGGVPVFVDVEPDTMNIDAKLIEKAITEKTKAIVCVHYAGVVCDMEAILAITKKYHLYLVEDAAQAFNAFYQDKSAGTFGDIGCFSFHETKNLSMGEGGALLINNPEMMKRAEIIREKGTNRSAFFRGEIDKYSWVDLGSSFLPSDLNAACLYAQLENLEEIQNRRFTIWNQYEAKLRVLEEQKKIQLPVIPDKCRFNAHIFYFYTSSAMERNLLLKYLKENEISAVFHYVPLHSSTAGQKFGRFEGEDKYTTQLSDRLVRLPLYFGLTDEMQNYVIDKIYAFYH